MTPKEDDNGSISPVASGRSRLKLSGHTIKTTGEVFGHLGVSGPNKSFASG